MGRKSIDLIGQKFGRLTVLEEAGKDKSYHKIYKCKCDCGNMVNVNSNHLVTGNTKSCGCLKKEKLTKHGKSNTKIYKVYQNIIDRCYNPKSSNYHKYGKQGVSVCDEWKKNFLSFYEWSVSNGYKEGLTIDRINTYGNYEPNNCRWTDYETQNTNLKMLKNNKSGYRGCHYLKKYKKWLANISINNKTVHIGVFDTLKDCVKARNDFIDENKLPHQKNIWRETDV